MNPFRNKRGLPQGDTASPFLFVPELKKLLLRRIRIVCYINTLFRAYNILLKITPVKFSPQLNLMNTDFCINNW